MNHFDAAKILGITGSITPEIVKAAYRLACKKYHPDRNAGGLEMMKSVNVAYEALKDQTIEVKHDNVSYGDDLMAVINALSDLEGIELELCGSWLWVSGDTKPHKETIKGCKCRWAPKKKLWYFRPEDYKSFGRGKFSMDEIRSTHGSSKVSGNGQRRLAS